MSTTKPSPTCPKFISVEGDDIYSRSKPDGNKFLLYYLFSCSSFCFFVSTMPYLVNAIY